MSPLTRLHDADDAAWMTAAACHGVPLRIFVPDSQESAKGLETARAWCNPCPVRTECLAWAMLHRAEGYWGGTSTYQRNQLMRVRTRAKCPLCASVNLVYADPHELCLACGMSWIRDIRLQPLAATPLPHAAA
jgi:hypothetical protein